MSYSFFSFGHPNVLASHKTTLEFTRSKNLTLKGDCIVGVDSDFDSKALKDLALTGLSVAITIESDGRTDVIHARLNKDFDDHHEIVIRKGDFLSKRTFAVMADKAACDLDRVIIEKMKDAKTKMIVTIELLP